MFLWPSTSCRCISFVTPESCITVSVWPVLESGVELLTFLGISNMNLNSSLHQFLATAGDGNEAIEKILFVVFAEHGGFSTTFHYQTRGLY